jgi:DNA repair protein RadD
MFDRLYHTIDSMKTPLAHIRDTSEPPVSGISRRTPWEHQVKAVNHVLTWAEKHPAGRLLLACPPGGGKTLIMAMLLDRLAIRRDQPGLVIGHRREMVDHHYSHLVEHGIYPSLLGVIMAGDPRVDPRARIQIASIDTLHRLERLPPARCILTDEAHRDASNGRRRIRAAYPNSLLVGLTGTPCRCDDRGLADDYDDMYVVATTSELLARGYIVAPRIFTVPKHMRPNLARMRVVRGDYDTRDAEVECVKLVGHIVPNWLRLAMGRKTVVFANSIAHSKTIIDGFQKAGIEAAHLDLSSDPETRKDLLHRFKNGSLTVLSCVNILAEGWDCPPCKCVIMARPTCSLSLFLQQCGRCMRPWEDGPAPIVLDHAGNALVHGLPDTDRPWALDYDEITASKGAAPVRCCSSCNAVVHAATRRCPECGLEMGAERQVPDAVPGELEAYEVTSLASAATNRTAPPALPPASVIRLVATNSDQWRHAPASRTFVDTAPASEPGLPFVEDEEDEEDEAAPAESTENVTAAAIASEPDAARNEEFVVPVTRPRGRPRKSNDERRTATVPIRMSTQEKAEFTAFAERRGLNLSQWLRSLAYEKVNGERGR